MYFCDKLFLSGVFMDRTTFEAINKGKRNFIILLISLSVCIGIVVGLFTNYKEEILVCSKIDDNCYVEKIKIFSTEYYEKDEVKDVVSNLQEQLKNNDVKVIKIIRKL